MQVAVLRDRSAGGPTVDIGVHRMLVDQRGWTPERYQEWIADTIDRLVDEDGEMGTTKQIPRSSRVEVEVAAPVDAVWRVVADVTRTGEWSHECRRVAWLDGAAEASYGARFRGGNKWLVFRWSRTNEITELERGRAIGWRTLPSWRFPDSTEWRFVLERTADGTRITQTYEVVHAAAWWSWLMARVVPPHRDRSAALAADLRRIGEVVRSA